MSFSTSRFETTTSFRVLLFQQLDFVHDLLTHTDHEEKGGEEGYRYVFSIEDCIPRWHIGCLHFLSRDAPREWNQEFAVWVDDPCAVESLSSSSSFPEPEMMRMDDDIVGDDDGCWSETVETVDVDAWFAFQSGDDDDVSWSEVVVTIPPHPPQYYPHPMWMTWWWWYYYYHSYLSSFSSLSGYPPCPQSPWSSSSPYPLTATPLH